MMMRRLLLLALWRQSSAFVVVKGKGKAEEKGEAVMGR